jgi:hypothetical protein
VSYRDDYRQGERDALWTLPRLLIGAFAAIVAVFLLLVLVTPLTIGFGWFHGEANLRSFEHVRQTYGEAFDDTAAMDANARQACRLDKLIASTDDPAVRSQRQTQVLAIENNYDRVKGEYEAYMSDHFRGGVIRPKQLPMPYPSIEDRKTEVC